MINEGGISSRSSSDESLLSEFLFDDFFFFFLCYKWKKYAYFNLEYKILNSMTLFNYYIMMHRTLLCACDVYVYASILILNVSLKNRCYI